MTNKLESQCPYLNRIHTCFPNDQCVSCDTYHAYIKGLDTAKSTAEAKDNKFETYRQGYRDGFSDGLIAVKKLNEEPKVTVRDLKDLKL